MINYNCEEEFFQNCRTTKELAEEYRRLMRAYPPNRTEMRTMQKINDEYEAARKRIKEAKKWRLIEAIVFFAGTLVVSAMMGAILGGVASASSGAFWEDFKKGFLFMYIVFGSGSTIALFLAVFTQIQENLLWVFGYGLFYGTVLPGALISKLIKCEDWIIYALTFTISALICYIVWLKRKSNN